MSEIATHQQSEYVCNRSRPEPKFKFGSLNPQILNWICHSSERFQEYAHHTAAVTRIVLPTLTLIHW